MKSQIVKSLIICFSLQIFINCIETPDESKRKKESKKDTFSDFYNTYALAGGFQSKDACTDEYWTRTCTCFIGYIILYDSSKVKVDCAAVSLPTASDSHTYNADGSLVTTTIISQQTPRIPLQCRHVKSSNPTYSVNSWYKQDLNNPRNANFLFKHTLQKDLNGNITGMDSFTNYNSGDILYCCDQPAEHPLCDKIQIK